MTDTRLDWSDEDTKAFLISLASGIITAILIAVIIRRG
jgi:hypothetical protein